VVRWALPAAGMKRYRPEIHYSYCGIDTSMNDLIPLIPGFYTDDEGHLFVDMETFLREHGMPDSPEVRRVVWDEIRDIFGDLPIMEIAS
jgi:hypothetical protein